MISRDVLSCNLINRAVEIETEIAFLMIDETLHPVCLLPCPHAGVFTDVCRYIFIVCISMGNVWVLSL